MDNQVKKKLFKYYIEENTKVYNDQSLFQYRCNRWRFSSKDFSTCNKQSYNQLYKNQIQIIFLFILNLFTIYAILVGKVMRVKKPLCAVAGALMIYDFTYGYLAQDAHH